MTTKPRECFKEHSCLTVQAGSIADYLPKYLEQIVQFGYAHTPYALDAPAHEATS